MIGQFWLYFLGTGVVMRILTPPFHFRKKTITHYLREKTKKEIHHLHFGLLFAIMALMLIFAKGLTQPLLFFAAMAMSFIADEVFLIKDFTEYFSKKGLMLSVVGHVLIGLAMTAILIIMFS